MKFFKAVISAFRNIFDYTGRSNRREFWYWAGFVVIVWLLCRAVDLAVIAPMRGFAAYEQGAGAPLSNLWLLICILPTLALIVRRVHDHGKSGWWALTVVPLVWWLFGKGDKGENRFG